MTSPTPFMAPLVVDRIRHVRRLLLRSPYHPTVSGPWPAPPAVRPPKLATSRRKISVYGICGLSPGNAKPAGGDRRGRNLMVARAAKEPRAFPWLDRC